MRTRSTCLFFTFLAFTRAWLQVISVKNLRIYHVATQV